MNNFRKNIYVKNLDCSQDNDLQYLMQKVKMVSKTDNVNKKTLS